MVWALLLAAHVATAAQEQHAAGAMYRVMYHAAAIGSFTVDVRGDSFYANADETDVAVGAAFAVSPDGYLMTARHVVDLQDLANDYCRSVNFRYTRSRVDQIKLDMVLTDIVDSVVGAQFVITPPPGSPNDICHSTHPLKIAQDAVWPVRIVATDSIADLGLIKINRSDAPISFLPWGAIDAEHRDASVYSFGYPQLRLSMRLGVLLVPCERYVPHDQPAELLTRYLMDAEPGMSGGPVISDGRILGIISRANGVNVTSAVPVDYAHAWYLFVRGLSKKRPTQVCKP